MVETVGNLRKIAEETRKWAEISGNEYGFPQDLMGFCALASKKLFVNLKKANFSPEVAIHESDEVGGHCFVVCDNYILDVTATQFSNDPVCVVKVGSNESQYDYWEITKKYRSISGLMRRLKAEWWPAYQIYYGGRVLYIEGIKE